MGQAVDRIVAVSEREILEALSSMPEDGGVAGGVRPALGVRRMVDRTPESTRGGASQVVQSTFMSEGFFSILRYSANPSRGEARNVALVLVDQHSDEARVKAAPLSYVAPRLAEHGLLDALIVRLADRIDSGELRSREALSNLSSQLGPTLTLTQPRATAIVQSVDATLQSLFRAYVSATRARRGRVSRGDVLNRVVQICRSAGTTIQPGAYLRDVMFDAVLRAPTTEAVVQALSFDTDATDPRVSELAAGYFLHGLARVGGTGILCGAAPTPTASSSAGTSYDRVSRWMADAGASFVEEQDFRAIAASMAGVRKLPLEMAI